MTPARTVGKLSSAEAVEALLSLSKAAEPILDVTWGNGCFWTYTPRTVWGCDKDPMRARNQVVDFTNLPFTDGQFPTVVYDPPFHPNVKSIEHDRFRSMGNSNAELKQLFVAGLKECWRVTSRHLLVKCQDFINGGKPQWMPLWAVEVCGEPWEWMTTYRDNKRISGRWKTVRSLHRNHAVYLLFDKRGSNHGLR